MRYVIECEKSFIIRVGNKLITNKNIIENPDEKPQSLSKNVQLKK